ncbi:hypothetical protein JHK87_027201 [Glycine soja]|nr:hypothetical protein JHK87_027201 [Glycine soja]
MHSREAQTLILRNNGKHSKTSWDNTTRGECFTSCPAGSLFDDTTQNHDGGRDVESGDCGEALHGASG